MGAALGRGEGERLGGDDKASSMDRSPRMVSVRDCTDRGGVIMTSCRAGVRRLWLQLGSLEAPPTAVATAGPGGRVAAARNSVGDTTWRGRMTISVNFVHPGYRGLQVGS